LETTGCLVAADSVERTAPNEHLYLNRWLVGLFSHCKTNMYGWTLLPRLPTLHKLEPRWYAHLWRSARSLSELPTMSFPVVSRPGRGQHRQAVIPV